MSASCEAISRSYFLRRRRLQRTPHNAFLHGGLFADRIIHPLKNYDKTTNAHYPLNRQCRQSTPSPPNSAPLPLLNPFSAQTSPPPDKSLTKSPPPMTIPTRCVRFVNNRIHFHTSAVANNPKSSENELSFFSCSFGFTAVVEVPQPPNPSFVADPDPFTFTVVAEVQSPNPSFAAEADPFDFVVVVVQSPKPESKPEVDGPVLNPVFVPLEPKPLVVVIANSLAPEFNDPLAVDDGFAFGA